MKPPIKTLLTATASLLIVSLSTAQTGSKPSENPAPAAGSKTPAVSAPSGAGKTIRFITDFESPPFAYKNGIKREGAEIELGEEIGKAMGAKVVWVEKNFNMSTYASALNTGSADAALANISVTDARKRIVDFTEPYWRTSLALAVKKNVDWEHQWFTGGLKGWTVGVIRNTVADSWARVNLAAEVKTYSSMDRLSNALKNSPMPLKSGKAGFCILHDRPILLWALSKYSYHYEIVESNITKDLYAIAVRKGNTKLLEELNTALAKIREEGSARKIFAKWLKEAEDLPLYEQVEPNIPSVPKR